MPRNDGRNPIGAGLGLGLRIGLRKSQASEQVVALRTEYNLSDFGAVGDGVTDDAAALLSMNTQLRALQDATPRHFILNGNGGNYVYSANTWLFGLIRFELNGGGGTFQCTSTDPNGRANTSFNTGQFFETDASNPGGPPQYRDGNLFDSAAAGAFDIVLADQGDIAEYSAGKRVVLYGFLTQDGGYPPNVRYFEYKTVESVDIPSGTITFTEPLLYAYDDRWIDQTVSQVPIFGKPRILSLDRPDYVWPEVMVLRRLHALINPNFALDSWGFSARNVFCEDVRFHNMFPAMGESFVADGCVIERACTPDKMIRHAHFYDCDILRHFGDAISAEVASLQGCRLGADIRPADTVLNVAAVNFTVRDCVIFGNTDSEFGIISLAEAYSGAYAEFTGNAVHNRSANLRYIINTIPELTFTIEDVDGDDILFTRNANNIFLTHAIMRPGWIFWREDGLKVGRFINAFEDPDTRIRVQADWFGLAPPVIAENWEIRANDELITSNNRIASGLQVPLARSPVLAPRSGTKRVLLTYDDLNFVFGNTTTFPVKGYLRRLEINLKQTVAVNDFNITVEGTAGNTQMSIDVSTPGTRYISNGVVDGLGTDVLSDAWADSYTDFLRVNFIGAAALPYKSIFYIICDIDGFGI